VNQENRKPVFLEYFNQGSETLVFFKDILVRYLNDRVGIRHYQLTAFRFLYVLGILLLPIHFLITDKKQLKLTWEIIKQLSPRRYQGNLIKEVMAMLVWEFRFVHFKLVVYLVRPDFFICADSAFFLLRWMKFCKKKNIVVIRDFTDYSYSFSILRDKNYEVRCDYDFAINLDEINEAELESFSQEFDNRLSGVSRNVDHVLAYNPINNNLKIESKRIKVLLATHIFGDAASAHISMFRNFRDWVQYFLNYFSDRSDDFVLIVKEHPAAGRYLEEGFLLKLLGDSGVANKVLYVPGHTQLSHENVDIVITGNGSIAHEYIYRNKPVVSTSAGFSRRYKGCYFALSHSDIDAFFREKSNIEKLRKEAVFYHKYNLKLSYVFHKCPNLRNNQGFRSSFESKNYQGIASFFDEAGLLSFIFGPDNKNHYFVLEPKLIS
jgi:hypothetical protein